MADLPEVQPDTTQQPTAPPVSKGEKLYSNLTNLGFGEQQLGKKEEFLQALQNPIKANKIYSGLRVAGLGEEQLGSLKEFQTSFAPQPKQSQPVNIPGVPNTLPTSQPQADLTPVTPEYREQLKQQQQAKAQAVSDHFKQLRSELDPEAQKGFDKAIQMGTEAHPDQLGVPSKESIDHYNYMQTPAGKLIGAAKYIGSETTHGTIQLAKGLAHVANMANNPAGTMVGLDPTNEAFKKADKFADYGLTDNDKATIENMSVPTVNGHRVGIGTGIAAAGQMANFAPSIAAGEAAGLPKTLLYLQGLGQAKEMADKMPNLNPLAKEALIQGGGVVNMALSDFGGKVFGKGVSSAVKDKVVQGIATDALKEAAEKELSEDGYKNLLTGKTQAFVEKFDRAPSEVLKHYVDATKTFTKLNVGNYAVHKAVDALQQSQGDKPVFNENLGTLAENESNSLTKQVPLFGSIGAIGAASKLLPNSGYANEITKAVISDPKQANIDNIKYNIEQHGHENGWNSDEINTTHEQIDKIAKAVKSLPATVKDKTKAVGLVLDRNELQTELDKSVGERKELDPAVADIPSAKEQYLTDKIEQANDKLRALVKDQKPTYSKGLPVNNEEGKFFKTTDGVKEEITPSRYDLENTEREAKKTIHEQTEPNQEIPAEQPADETIGVPKVADQNDETTKNNINTKTQEDGKNDEKMGGKPSGQESGQSGNEENGSPGEKEVVPSKEKEVVKSGEAKTEPETIEPKTPEEIDKRLAEIDTDLKRPKEDTSGDEKTGQAVQLNNYLPESERQDLEKEKTDLLKQKGETDNAVQESKTEGLPLQPKTENSLGVSEENPEGDKTADKGKEVKTSEKSKIIADKIRSLKINKTAADIKKSNMHGGLQGIGTAVYDGALETAATVIEKGGLLADAIDEAVKHILANSDEKDKEKIRDAVTKDLSDAGIKEDEVQKERDAEQVKTYGTKNAITEELQQGLGLPPIEIPKDRSDDESLASWKNGKRTPMEITEQLLDPNTDIYDKSITPNDEPIMREYIRQLGERGKELNKIKLHLQDKVDAGDKDAEYDVASVGEQIDRHLDEYNNALNASKVAGNIWHKVGDERQKAIDDHGLILNAIERIRNIYGKDIPADVKKQLDDLQKRNDELTAKIDKIVEDSKKKVAEKTVEAATKRTKVFGARKLSDAEFKGAVKDILSDLKKDWKKSFTNTYITVPGIPQFNAIAPHIAKMVRLYAERGISKLDDIISHIHNDVKDDLEGITKDDIRDLIAGKYSDKKPISELRKQVNDLRVQARNQAKIEELEKGILAKTKAKGESSPEVKALQKQVLELKKKVINDNPALSAEQLRKEAATIQKKIDKGEYFKQPVVKKLWENNPDWIKSNKEKGELNARLKKLERDAMDSKKSAYMRGLDKTNRWGRRVIFFGANAVYTHLASSAVIGSLLHRGPEFLVGKGINKLFPRLAEGAPIEGNLNLQTEAKFWKRIINVAQTAKNTKDIFLHGETDMSKELSKRPHENVIPGLDFFAAGGHQAIKDPIVEATTLASQEAYMNYYRSHGLDETHPLMLESARQSAYNRAQYEIFQNTAKNANVIKGWFNQLEKKAIKNAASDDWYDRAKGNAQYTAKSIYDFMVPINTAPTNMVERQMLSLRLPDKLIKAWNENSQLKKGIDRLSAEDKDLLLLQLKKGTVGAFYWTLGAALAGSAAGGLYTKFYSDKDRDKAENGAGLDPASGFLHLGGTDIPKDWQHNYQFQALQNGATWNMIYWHYRNDKDESIAGAFAKAGFGTTEAISEEVPSIKSVFDLKEAGTTSYGEEKYLKSLKRRVGIKKVQDLSKLAGYNLGDDDQ